MQDSIAPSIVELKSQFVHGNGKSSYLQEIIPLSHSKHLPIADNILKALHKFAKNNSIYLKSRVADVVGIPCAVYEGDINDYWLSSKKYDTSYQPFYPTWILSAFALAYIAKNLGFREVVDIGSGDGRIAYCARLLGMQAIGIEIDSNLVQLQQEISVTTGVKYDTVNADATRFDYCSLHLTRPMFFISGLPEMGEMLANGVLSSVPHCDGIKHSAGFNFMGTHVMKTFTRDQTGWGWGSIIDSFNLELIGAVTLPTHWTTDQTIDTAYVYAKSR